MAARDLKLNMTPEKSLLSAETDGVCRPRVLKRCALAGGEASF